jgi:hypothetical protein
MDRRTNLIKLKSAGLTALVFTVFIIGFWPTPVSAKEIEGHIEEAYE